MDPLTHLATGMIVSNIFTYPNVFVKLFVSVVGSIIPDGDLLLNWEVHQEYSHSIFVVPFLALPLSFITNFIFAKNNYLIIFFLFSCMMFVHILLDILVHGSGAKLFWPFTQKRYNFHIFMGLNPMTAWAKCYNKSILTCTICQSRGVVFNFIFIVAFIGTIMETLIPESSLLISILVVILVFLYTVICIFQKRKAMKIVKFGVPHFLQLKKLQVYPAGFSPFRWLAVGETADKIYTCNIDNIATPDRKLKLNEFKKHIPTREIEKSKNTKTIKEFLRGALFPSVNVIKTERGAIVEWTDLAYSYSSEAKLFTAKIEFSDSLKVIREEFRERW